MPACAETSPASGRTVGTDGRVHVRHARWQQFFPVQDLHHAIIAHAPGGVDPIPDYVIRRCTTGELARRIGMFMCGIAPWSEEASAPSRAGCPPGKPKVRTVNWQARGSLQSYDQHRLRLAPERQANEAFLLPGR